MTLSFASYFLHYWYLSIICFSMSIYYPSLPCSLFPVCPSHYNTSGALTGGSPLSRAAAGRSPPSQTVTRSPITSCGRRDSSIRDCGRKVFPPTSSGKRVFSSRDYCRKVVTIRSCGRQNSSLKKEPPIENAPILFSASWDKTFHPDLSTFPHFLTLLSHPHLPT